MSDSRAFSFPWPSTVAAHEDHAEELGQLRAECASLRAEMKHREESAYLHGLGSAAEVYRQNKLLTDLVSALIDPAQRLNLRHVPPKAAAND